MEPFFLDLSPVLPAQTSLGVYAWKCTMIDGGCARLGWQMQVQEYDVPIKLILET